MSEFWPFFLVVFVTVFLSLVSKRLHIPWVVGLLTVGALIGPFGFDLVKTDPTLTLLSEIGLMFLMFMAGLETRLSTFRIHRHDIVVHSVLHLTLPFLAGILLGVALQLPMIESVVLGIVFVSSSVALIIPALQGHGLLHTNVGRVIVGSTIIVDAISLIMLSLLLDLSQGQPLPAITTYFTAIIVVLLLQHFLPALDRFLSSGRAQGDTEQEVRVALLLLVGTAILFSLVGLHPILGGFFAGMVLSDTVRSQHLRAKLHALGYGVFIPIFYVFVGMQVDLSSFAQLRDVFLLSLVLFVGMAGSKYFAGVLGGRMDGYSREEAELMGYAGLPRLSTTLVAVFAAAEFSLLSGSVASALVMTSVCTALVAPFLVRHAACAVKRRK